MHNATRAEAERLLGIAEKLLQNRDLLGSREFAILAQETEPLLEGSDQILATIDVLIASEKRVNNQPDWYSILQINHRSDDIELIKKQYRRLALLLHPDKSRFYFADHAFKLVADAWAILSDPIKKAHYDKGFSFFSRVDLSVPGWVQQQEKLPVRRTEPVPRSRPRSGPGPSPGQVSRDQGYDPRNSAAVAREEVAAGENSRRRKTTFWTACPYCYRLYEYPKVYDGCCLKCPNCDRSFHGVEVPNLPPLVPGQEAYYCCWGFFPMGFVNGTTGSAEKEAAPAAEPEPELEPVPESEPEPEPVPVQQAQPASSLPNWMPVPAQAQPQAQAQAQPASSLPNWMPVAAENGGNNAMQETAPMRMPMPAPSPTRVTRRSTAVAVGVPNGVARGGSGSAPKKRGRPRKYPLQS